MTKAGKRVAVEVSGDAPPAHVVAPVKAVEAYLAAYVAGLDLPGNLKDAVGYALLGGGKRLRPVLAWHCCGAVGGDPEVSLPAGGAVELVHAFSLVHDDLPAMDNDDFRRGIPTLHKARGEAMAILAGDAMLNLAFELVAGRVKPEAVAARIVVELAAGTSGMIAGQVYDTLGGFEGGLTEEARLRLVHRNKTGALIRAACRMGAMAGLARAGEGGVDERMAAVTRYAEDVGLMFQIVDDILDVTQASEHVGKKTGKDAEAGKLTYPGVMGVERARREVERVLADALSAIAPLGIGPGEPARPLAELAAYMAVRTK